METIIFDLNYLDESSKRELAAYRNIGSVYALRRLQREKVRKERRFERNLRILKNVTLGACIALDLWILASWIDVVLHNLDPYPVYQAWNLFVLLF